jgi:hypothetical protein
LPPLLENLNTNHGKSKDRSKDFWMLPKHGIG